MPPPFSFQPRVEPLAGPAGTLPLAALAARLGPGPLVLLDGWGGASVLAFDPLPGAAPRGLAGLRRLLARLEPRVGDELPGWFQGGFLGALAYERGAAAEPGMKLPPDPWGLPGLIGGLFTDFLVREESAGRTFLVLGEEPGDGRPPVMERARALRDRLARPIHPEPLHPLEPVRRLVTPAEHARRIVRVREYIAAGEIYQANLTYRMECAVRGDPLELYLRLRALHPAPHGGFLRVARGALLSASPELLLEFGRDGFGGDACESAESGTHARTRPIKGTAPRGRDVAEDRALAAALLASGKDRSELAMIVDLERNDLGRIARPGSVCVGPFPELESYATVHHLAAEVRARPRPEVDALQVLGALFPGGSVTGAPKLRSMEVIAELEREGRGFAYGSMMALDTRGDLRANLLIRTLIWRPCPVPRGKDSSGAGSPSSGEVTLRVGGGITWGSDPEAEVAEAESKATLLLRALEGGANEDTPPALRAARPGSEWLPERRDVLL